MARLTFTIDDVRPLLEHAERSIEWRALYEQPETAAAGLWIVGDQGVYLMSNGKPPQPRPGGGKDALRVAYAKGLSPDDPEWFDRKRDRFGGDDGVDWIPAANVREVIDRAESAGRRTFQVNLSRTSISLSG